MLLNYVLLGGPYDGVQRETEYWPDPPEVLWVRPGGNARFGLLIGRHQKPGAERYVLSALQPGEAFYQHDSINTLVGPVTFAEAAA